MILYTVPIKIKVRTHRYQLHEHVNSGKVGPITKVVLEYTFYNRIFSANGKRQLPPIETDSYHPLKLQLPVTVTILIEQI